MAAACRATSPAPVSRFVYRVTFLNVRLWSWNTALSRRRAFVARAVSLPLSYLREKNLSSKSYCMKLIFMPLYIRKRRLDRVTVNEENLSDKAPNERFQLTSIRGVRRRSFFLHGQFRTLFHPFSVFPSHSLSLSPPFSLARFGRGLRMRREVSPGRGISKGVFHLRKNVKISSLEW